MVITCGGHTYTSAFHGLGLKVEQCFLIILLSFLRWNILEGIHTNIFADIIQIKKKDIHLTIIDSWILWLTGTKKVRSCLEIIFVAYQELQRPALHTHCTLMGGLNLYDVVLPATSWVAHRCSEAEGNACCLPCREAWRRDSCFRCRHIHGFVSLKFSS